MNIDIFSYPETKQKSVIDTYYNSDILDPYQWLEEINANETAEWVTSQNKWTANYFSQIPFYSKIKEELELLWNHEKYSEAFKIGSYVYFYMRNGLENQFVLYREKEGQQAETFLNAKELFQDENFSITEVKFSKDGSLAAFQLNENGSDLQKVFIIRTSDKTIIEAPLSNVMFSRLAWKGNEGFFYSSYHSNKKDEELVYNHKLYYHKIGSQQVEDVLIFGGEKEPRRFVQADVTEDQKYLVMMAANSLSGNELYIKDLENGDLTTIVNNTKNHNFIINNIGSKLFILTNLEAPNFKVVTIDISNPIEAGFLDLIPETEDVLSTSVVGGKIYAKYIKNITSLIKQYSFDGAFEKEIKLPSDGSVFGFNGNNDEVYYTFESYIHPPTIYKYDVRRDQTTILKRSNGDFDSKKYESKLIFYPSKDGTKIPMTLLFKKGLRQDGRSPTLVYGYGGFGFNILPEFDPSNILLLEQGGILAVPNLRGGGEYGLNWHEAGARLNKKNVIDDFTSAIEYLIDQNYTSNDYVSISGRSNGGMIVGSIIAQFPNLCKVAFPSVGVMDMLRFHKFGSSITWASEYGTSEESQELFEYLLSYSPYHQLTSQDYPAVLVTTADYDDRVIPAHSYKFLARLQELQTGDSPVILNVEKNMGHGAGKSTTQKIKQETDKWAFMFYNMGLTIEL